MPIEEATYNGRKIVIDTEGRTPRLTIDGKNIPLVREATGKFIANQHSSYLSFDSLFDLAKHVIDHILSQHPG